MCAWVKLKMPLLILSKSLSCTRTTRVRKSWVNLIPARSKLFVLYMYTVILLSSLNIEFYQFKRNIVILTSISSTDPQLNVISCRSIQCLCKPWRVVEFTTCAGGYTCSSLRPTVDHRDRRCIDYSMQSSHHSHRSNHFQQMEGPCHYVMYHKDRDGQGIYCLIQSVQQQMSKCVHDYHFFHDSDLLHQHIDHQCLEGNSRKH